jgi:hypothetical protein
VRTTGSVARSSRRGPTPVIGAPVRSAVRAAALALLVSTLSLAAVEGATAQEAPAPAAVADAPRPEPPRKVESSTRAIIINYPCWTSFYPVNPHGRSMAQTYNNCGSTGYDVCPAVTLWGQKTVWTEARLHVGPSDNSNNADLAQWEYGSTEPYGAQYSTEFC